MYFNFEICFRFTNWHVVLKGQFPISACFVCIRVLFRLIRMKRCGVLSVLYSTLKVFLFVTEITLF